MLQKETKMDLVMPVPPPNVPLQLKKDTEKVSGSLSDGSVCELPPLSKMALRRNQFQNQPSYYRLDTIIPPYKANGVSRKRFSSTGDKDQTGSSGYETSSKIGRSDNSVSPALKPYNPVMENRVSSTNNDVVYKFTGLTPAEDFEVTYTVEERVKAAAFAIVYNNCKISTDKFEVMYDKPAPDFKTIFAWRQRLLTTGCLVDTHLEMPKKDVERSATNITPKTNNSIRKKINQKPLNPDEIAIISDTDDDGLKNTEANNHSTFGLRQKSISTDTLLIGGIDSEARVAGGSSVDERISQGRSHSASTHHRTRSSSRDSQDSNYPDSDLEQTNTNIVNRRKSPPPKTSTTRQSVNESDSDSYSYNSDEVDFRSRVFGDRKMKRKVKKRSNPSIQTSYVSNENQSFQGYSTLKALEQSPLVTGNIYTVNFRNMSVIPRHQDNHNMLDTDGCSSEYVPTRLGATAKKNYQDFKNNVKKRGFWAKGNGNSFSKNVTITSSSPIVETNGAPVESSHVNDYYIEAPSGEPQGYSSTQLPGLEIRNEDFTKDEIDNGTTVDHYMPFDKPSDNHNVKPFENSYRIFDIVQSNPAIKNKSIMDIFGNNESYDSAENNNVDNIECSKKRYETVWDEDDDALYKDSDSVEISTNSHRKRTPSPPSIGSLRTQSPTTDMLYATNSDVKKVNETQFFNQDFIRDKHEMLLGLLEDIKENKEKNIVDQVLSNTTKPIKIQQTENITNVSNQVYQQKSPQIMNHNCLNQKVPPIPTKLSDEIRAMSEEVKDKSPAKKNLKIISPSKKVHVLESITIKADKPVNIPHIQSNTIQYNADQTHSVTEQPKEVNTVQGPTVPETNTTNNQNQISPQLDLTGLLSGINTNTLLLALQNLQHLTQKTNDIPNNDPTWFNCQDARNNEGGGDKLETINLTNDEDWEKESNQDESIERELEKLDGSTGDTPFLSDIFDPGPVVLPPNINKKLNINLKNPDESKKNQTLHLNENAPVIGNFKSFALPKPILLNRLKLTVKQTEKNTKDGRRGKRNKKVCM